MQRHLFWDMGGTLVDTYPQLDEAFARVVRAHGGVIELLDVARLTRVSTGAAIATLAERFGIDPGEFEQANEALKQHWERQPAPAMPGAAALLDDVWAGASASPLVVITHDPDVRARCDRALILG